MNIDDLKEKAEDSEPVQEKLNPETEEFLMSGFIYRYREIFRVMKERMKSKGMTVSDLKNEIEAKKSPFSANQRSFIMGFKTEFLEKCLNKNGN